jgi:hypothetical protein
LTPVLVLVFCHWRCWQSWGFELCVAEEVRWRRPRLGVNNHFVFNQSVVQHSRVAALRDKLIAALPRCAESLRLSVAAHLLSRSGEADSRCDR